MAGMTGADREKRWRSASRMDARTRPSHSLFVALLLACATLITLDAHAGEDSPLDPARTAVASVLGPAQSAVTAVVEPLSVVPEWFSTHEELRERIARLEARNTELRQEVMTQTYESHRVQQLEGLIRTAAETGHALIPAHVVAMGSAQSFSRTVTIDAGRTAGIRPDMTVVTSKGLVGRVLRVSDSTATVLLIVDRESVVGARLGRTQEIGFLRGRGTMSDRGRLDLMLLDGTAVPSKGDVVLSWGSTGGKPYVPGIPIGRVTGVYSTPRDTTKHAVVDPFVDFSALDLVGVVVPSGTDGTRPVIRADGSVR